MSIVPQEIQIQKNQILHGVSLWSPVGLGLSTLVVTGEIIPGGQVVQTGNTVVEVDVASGLCTPMTVVQSTLIVVAVAVVNKIILLVGQAKWIVVTPGQGKVMAVAGVWKE